MPIPDLKPHIKTVLDIGIGHITEKDSKLLRRHVGDDEDFPVAIMEYQYGFLISAWHHSDSREPEEVEEFEKDFLEVGFSKEFLALIKLACGEGCNWLQLDRDGDTVDGLPVFKW
jgi:hypothetical protein